MCINYATQSKTIFYHYDSHTLQEQSQHTAQIQQSSASQVFKLSINASEYIQKVTKIVILNDYYLFITFM